MAAARRTIHIAIDRLARHLVQPGCIHKDNLVVILGFNPQHLVAGGLGFAGSNTDFLPENVIEQRRFTHIGAADDRDIATALAISCIVIQLLQGRMGRVLLRLAPTAAHALNHQGRFLQATGHTKLLIVVLTLHAQQFIVAAAGGCDPADIPVTGFWRPCRPPRG